MSTPSSHPSITFPARLRHQLIVSCQAPPGDPLDHPEVLRRLALSALRGGAGGLRANGAETIRSFRAETELSILGIHKRYRGHRSEITPDFASAVAIAQAGADVIALDCTTARAADTEPWPELVSRIHHELARPVLADVATVAEARSAEAAGADAVATTLYGYTPETEGQRSVNWPMVEELACTLRVPLLVEGHIRNPEDLRRAFELGAYAVVVGAAIARPESITAQFVHHIPPGF
uniref:N-acylglucosamine-6-phosphate 2-epimerase n=1 Tax=Acidobacterium capsulatum TaxID=33075 RepID=A0A7V4XQ44_9BACT